MRAKEYFEGIRAEVRKIAQAREMLERLRAKEGAKAQSYAVGGGSGDGNPMDAIASRIDFEGRLAQRIEDSRAEVDRALALLYGNDGRGGLAKLKGTRYADAICMAYLQCEQWSEIAEIMHSSEQWCRRICCVGFEYIDTVGWAVVKNA